MLSVSRQGRAGVNRVDERRKVTEKRGKKKRCEIKKKKDRLGEMLVVTLKHSDIQRALELVSESTYSHLHTYIHTHTLAE